MGTATTGTRASRAELDARQARRLARQSWPIRRYRLGEEPPDSLAETTTPAERFAMVWSLTALSWRLAGREIPVYPRREAPGRIGRSRGAD
jgi:hypothetical protein